MPARGDSHEYQQTATDQHGHRHAGHAEDRQPHGLVDGGHVRHLDPRLLRLLRPGAGQPRLHHRGRRRPHVQRGDGGHTRACAHRRQRRDGGRAVRVVPALQRTARSGLCGRPPRRRVVHRCRRPQHADVPLLAPGRHSRRGHGGRGGVGRDLRSGLPGRPGDLRRCRQRHDPRLSDVSDRTGATRLGDAGTHRRSAARGRRRRDHVRRHRARVHGTSACDDPGVHLGAVVRYLPHREGLIAKGFRPAAIQAGLHGGLAGNGRRR